MIGEARGGKRAGDAPDRPELADAPPPAQIKAKRKLGWSGARDVVSGGPGGSLPADTARTA